MDDLERRANECAAYGHDWEIISSDDGSPISIACGNLCGQGPWKVVKDG